MNKNKLNIIMLSLTFILLCLILFCIVYGRGNLQGGGAQQTTTGKSQTGSVAPSTSAVPQLPTSTLQTTAATTMATVETTVETTIETTEETTEATTEPETVPDTDPDIGAGAAEIARQQVGKPYQYGTAGPDSFDTSGLIYYCFAQMDISVPRSNSGLASFGYEVSKEDIRPGDGVFFWSSEPGEPEYLGIYIGDGKVVAAMNASKPVVEFNMNSAYYTEHFVFVRRFY